VAPHRFILNGREFRLASDDVEARLRGVMPSKIHTYSVEVGGLEYPVKQALLTYLWAR
jgi:hypothetical protein